MKAGQERVSIGTLPELSSNFVFHNPAAKNERLGSSASQRAGMGDDSATRKLESDSRRCSTFEYKVLLLKEASNTKF